MNHLIQMQTAAGDQGKFQSFEERLRPADICSTNALDTHTALRSIDRAGEDKGLGRLMRG